MVKMDGYITKYGQCRTLLFLNLFYSIYKLIIFLSVKIGQFLKFRLELI